MKQALMFIIMLGLIIACDSGKGDALGDSQRQGIIAELSDLDHTMRSEIMALDARSYYSHYDDKLTAMDQGDFYPEFTKMRDEQLIPLVESLQEMNVSWDDLRYQVLTKDVAIMYGKFRSDYVTSDGDRVVHDVTVSYILQKRDGTWKIVHFQGSYSQDEEEGSE